MITRDNFLSEIYGINWMKYDWEPETHSMVEAIHRTIYDRLEFEVPATDSTSIHALIENGCHLSSSKVKYTFNNAYNPSRQEEKYTEAALEDVPELAQIATDSFVFDKYRNDPHLDKSKIPVMYREWISNGIRGRSDKTIAYRENGIIKGFTNTLIKPEETNIDLVGVRKDAERKGIGKGLIERVKEYYPGRMLSCVTQVHNIPMQRTLQNSGFRLTDARYILAAVR